jgi:hypothetical protein
MPPLIRALLEAFHEDAGAEEPRVDQSGRAFMWVYNHEEPLCDPAFIMQAAIQTDLALEALMGERGRFGLETVERLANEAGIEDAKSFYDERCRALHDTVTPEVMRDALKRARSMIAKDAWRARRIIAGSPGLDHAQVED